MTKNIDVSDLYFFQYLILSTAFNSKNLNDGIAKSLYLSKLNFNAGDVILYRADEYGYYTHVFNQPFMTNNSEIITSVLNSSNKLIENSKYYIINPNIDNLHSVMFIPIFLENTKYVISLSSDKCFENVYRLFIDLFTDTFRIILEKLEMINFLSEQAIMDSLTGLENRNSYEKDISVKQVYDGTVYALFDLFRLKYV